MGNAILVCGLNGAGKSTLAKALAERMNLRFIDIEDIYFSKQDISRFCLGFIVVFVLVNALA